MLLPYFAKWEQAGDTALEAAARSLGSTPSRLTRGMHCGTPARVLIEAADDLSTNLIAAGSGHKGAFGSLFFGSVIRGLVIGARRSVLIGRGDPRPDGAVTAVLATDHSDYANQRIDRLTEMRPSGFAHVTVLTAARFHAAPDGRLRSDSPLHTPDDTGWTRDELAERSEGVYERLRARGCQYESRIAEAHPTDAIESTIQETGAELLIIRAQGTDSGNGKSSEAFHSTRPLPALIPCSFYGRELRGQQRASGL